MIIKRKKTLGELTKELLDGLVFPSPAGSRVGSIEKFQDNPLNGIGHICNMVSQNYGGLLRVLVKGTSENSRGGLVCGSTAIIQGSLAFPQYLDVLFYAQELPQDFVANLKNYSSGKEKTRVLEHESGTHFSIYDKLDKWRTLLIKTSPQNPIDFPKLEMHSVSKEPGYLVRDVLEMAKFCAFSDSRVKVSYEKSLGKMAGDAFALAAMLPVAAFDAVMSRLSRESFFDME